MKKPVKIGNSQGFWGDREIASYSLLKEEPDLDFLTLDYLAEVSLSIMAIQREKNPAFGYAKDFLNVIASLIPLFKAGSKCKIITNAGGLNPKGLANEVLELLKKNGIEKKIAVVSGDDVLSLIKEDIQNVEFQNLDTKEPILSIKEKLVSANAYFGAKPIVEALSKDAEIVITGRVADPSLTVAAAWYYYDWKEDAYDKLASATVAGHLIECGTQVTGGISTDWLSVLDPAEMGYPFVEISEDGSFIISKPEEASGIVSEETVKEQLLYEILDPSCYVSPDVTVSFLTLNLKEVKKDRILVTNVKGFKPTEFYKLNVTYKNGFKAEGTLAIFGSDAVKKAKRAGEMILERVRLQGYDLKQTKIEVLGNLDVVSGVFKEPIDVKECVLRVAVSDLNYDAVSCFTKEIAPLVTSGPQGTTGYLQGRPHIREVFGFWPALILKSKIIPQVEIL